MFQSQSVHHMQCGQHDLSSCLPDVNTLSQDNSDCSIAVQNNNSNVGIYIGY